MPFKCLGLRKTKTRNCMRVIAAARSRVTFVEIAGVHRARVRGRRKLKQNHRESMGFRIVDSL